MKPEAGNICTPLLGVIVSEVAMLFKVYMLADDNNLIAEIDVCRLSSPSRLQSCHFARLVHVLVGWVESCSQFLSLSKASCLLCRYPVPTNVLILEDDRVYKSYDYRPIQQSFIEFKRRRSHKY
jgi:hypothetical protein